MKLKYIEGIQGVRVGKQSFTLGQVYEIKEEKLIEKLLNHPYLKFEKVKSETAE